ncbi:MAG: lecithin retinol acyltransferase family protein [Succinivibrio sp.]
MRLCLGDHLITGRIGYSHHGIYAGSGMVVAKTRSGVGMYTLEEFSRGQGIDVIEHADRAFSRYETVERAKSRLGEKGYSLLSSNCEDFANWCISGKSDSSQVRLAAAAAAGVAAAAGAAGLILSRSSAARSAAAALVGGGGAAVAVRAAMLVVKAADAARTARNMREASRRAGGPLETAVACAAVAAGADGDTALRIAQKAGTAADMAAIRARRIGRRAARAAGELRALLP